MQKKNTTAKKADENSNAALARHVAAIYNHPQTPTRLRNAVGDFIMDGTSLRVSACEFDTFYPGDVSLIENWALSPKTIERIIELTNKYNSDAKGVSQ
jgi:hypothetical protein